MLWKCFKHRMEHPHGSAAPCCVGRGPRETVAPGLLCARSPWIRAVLLLAICVAPISAATTFTIRVRSHQRWHATPVHVHKGDTLEFTATGTWWDFYIPCSADGYRSSFFYALGISPRIRDHGRYFRLMGRIASGTHAPTTDTQIDPNDPNATFVIGTRAKYVARRAGTLYVFANDLNWMYWNNWGFVTLKVVLIRHPQIN